MKKTTKLVVVLALLPIWTRVACGEQPTGKISCDDTLGYDKAIYTG